ncbi:MAG TPA: hypothetical protein VGK89_02020 [Candidatus Eisenbacteria bacterium]|jgi:hypothetical protein
MAPSVIDSLQGVVVHQEALILALNHRVDSLLAAVPDTVRDTIWAGFMDQRPHGLGIAPKDVIGWVVTAAGIFAAGWVARTGWNRSDSAGRRLQKDRHETEERRMREQLVLRIRGTLETMRATAASTLKKDATHPINPETMNNILVAWKRFDRVSDNLWLLNDLVMQDRIETITEFGRMTAEKIREDEQRFRETRVLLGQRSPEALIVHPSLVTRAVDQRTKLLTVVTKLRDTTAGLLIDFNAKWPPVAGHTERTEPETSSDEMPPVNPS